MVRPRKRVPARTVAEAARSHSLTSLPPCGEALNEFERLPSGRLRFLFVPTLVCYAFSIEIGLKALALYEKGKTSRNEHDLRKLFTFLPAALQERIIRNTEIIPGASFAPDTKRFESDLDLVRRVFVEWRYIYETRLVDTDLGFLQRFAAAIQGVLKEYP
jgi:hypothetical protein